MIKFKRGIFLLVLILCVSLASAVHNATVTIDPVSVYETNLVDFDLEIVYNSGNWFDRVNISIPTANLNVLGYNSLDGYNCWSDVYGSDYIISCDGIIGSPSEFTLNVQAELVGADTTVDIGVDTIDLLDWVLNSLVPLDILDDTTPPVLSNPIPVHQSFIQGTSTEVFSIQAVDDESGIKDGVIEYCVHDPPGLCETTISQPVICNGGICFVVLDISSYTEEMYAEFKFTIEDNAGNIVESQWYYAQIDRTSPNIVITAPDDDLFTNTIPDFIFTPTDNLGTNLNCELISNGISEANSVVVSGNQETYSGLSLNDGINSWFVRCLDEAGNPGETIPRTLTIDSTPPEIIIDPLPGWNTGIISITHTETDAFLDETSCYAQYDGLGPQPITCNVPFDIDTSNCPDGLDTCSLLIGASDLSGNSNTASITFSVDNSNPTINSINVNPDPVISNDTITITGSVSDVSGIDTCTMDFNGNIISLGNTCSGTYIVPDLPTNTYVLTFTATDLVGLFTTTTENLQVDNDVPVITLTDVPGNNTNDPDGSVDFIVNTDEPAMCSVFIDGIEYVMAAGIYVFDATPSSNNPYNWYIECTDSVGNVETTDNYVFYYDIQDPLISNVNIINIGTNSATITWDTSELAIGSIDYGNDILSLNLNEPLNILGDSHTLIISGLSASTEYFFAITAIDQAQRSFTDPTIYTFNTTSPPPGPPGGPPSGGCTPNWECLQWGNCLNGVQTCKEYKKTCNRSPPSDVKTKNCKMSTQETSGPSGDGSDEGTSFGCSDGIDNEGDGLIDEKDPDCIDGEYKPLLDEVNMDEPFPGTGGFIGAVKTSAKYLLYAVIIIGILALTYYSYQKVRHPRVKKELVDQVLKGSKIKK